MATKYNTKSQIEGMCKARANHFKYTLIHLHHIKLTNDYICIYISIWNICINFDPSDIGRLVAMTPPLWYSICWTLEIISNQQFAVKYHAHTQKPSQHDGHGYKIINIKIILKISINISTAPTRICSWSGVFNGNHTIHRFAPFDGFEGLDHQKGTPRVRWCQLGFQWFENFKQIDVDQYMTNIQWSIYWRRMNFLYICRMSTLYICILCIYI